MRLKIRGSFKNRKKINFFYEIPISAGRFHSIKALDSQTTERENKEKKKERKTRRYIYIYAYKHMHIYIYIVEKKIQK